jgi:hypothetical protein
MNADPTDPTADELAELEERLADPLWRLTSGKLYKIKTADGQGIIPFQPRPEQVDLLKELLAAVDGTGPRKIVRLKSRRLGFSTTIGVFVADCLGFRTGWTGTLIDQTQKDDATKKLNGIVKVALESLAEVWPIALTKSNDSAVVVDAEGTGASEFYAGTRARGGSNDLLWVSEWGAIQFDDPPRSEEIRSGALPSARHGVTVVETTWKGGKGGDVWEIIEPTINGKAADWAVSFVPWWVDPRNVAPEAVMDAEARVYFAEADPRLAAQGVTLTDAQKRWWAAERRTLGDNMKRENPTFLDECWTVPIPGAIYARHIERARVEGRICPMPVAGDCLVNTSWDLGSPRNTAVWYWQVVGREIRVVDYDAGFEGTLTERAAMMLGKGYNYGRHYLPHDALQTERSGSTFAAALTEAGLSNLVCVPRCASVWIGINHAIEMMPAIAWRTTPAVEKGLEALAAYRQHIEGTGALARNEPVHDWASHPADAFRVLAEAHRAGLFKFASAAQPKPEQYDHGRPGLRRGMKPRRVSR